MNETTHPSPVERMQSLQNALNTPTECKACGSTMFYEATLNQYAANRYSSGSGGDLSIISNMPQHILICPCGEPRLPNLSGVRGGRTANKEMAVFTDSLKRSIDYREKLRSNFTTVSAATNLASKEELDELMAKFEKFTANVKSLLEKRFSEAADQTKTERKAKG